MITSKESFCAHKFISIHLNNLFEEFLLFQKIISELYQFCVFANDYSSIWTEDPLNGRESKPGTINLGKYP